MGLLSFEKNETPQFWNRIHIWPDKAFKGTVVNQALAYLYEGSLEITLTVPLIMIYIIKQFKKKVVYQI